MSNTKHTPGPWQVDLENCHTGQVAVCHGDADTYYEVWTPNWAGGIDQKANANLIAAAPEMLEMLEEVTHQLKGAIDYLEEELDTRDIMAMDGLVVKAKAAIAKAKGE
jgi:hypothetical protein